MAYSTKFLLALAISAILACVVLAQPTHYTTASSGLVKRDSNGVMDINLESMPVERKNKDEDDDDKDKKRKNDDDDDDDNDDDEKKKNKKKSTATSTSTASSSKETTGSKKKGEKQNPDLIYDFNVKQKKTDCLSDGHKLLEGMSKKADKKKSKKSKKD